MYNCRNSINKDFDGRDLIYTILLLAIKMMLFLQSKYCKNKIYSKIDELDFTFTIYFILKKYKKYKISIDFGIVSC